ncbi:Pyrrolo-quinoline quinone [Desulfatibacillum aliphaticivorans]|uniref:Pyrrolo-quinoline quinone n=2 Tax=Desulfatibacillum aliphaticivorans TaxID=218208 RepID=B8FKI0_DESAL|nr:Pyrrolo-quinoline quinone [Desulfatibacillum aliphaticivorans]
MDKGGAIAAYARGVFMNRWVFPIWTAWAVFLYMHGVLILCCTKTVTSLLAVVLLFTPVMLFEWRATKKYTDLHPRSQGSATSGRRRFYYWLCNVVMWAMFYGIFVVYILIKLRATPGFKVYWSFFLVNNFLMWRSVMGWAWVALAYWMVMYYLLAVRAGRFRLICAVFLPLAITTIIFIVQWKIGGAGAASDETILSQAGVVKIMDVGEVSQALLRDYPDNLAYLTPLKTGFKTRGEIKASNKVREVFYDEALNAVFAFYGGTYYAYGSTTIPAIVKKDLGTGEISYLLTEHNVRRVEMTGDSMFVAPWHDNHLYEISKKDLSIVRSIPVGGYVTPMLWEPMDMALDVNGKALYIATSMYPSIAVVDLEANRQVKVMPLYEPGTLSEGGWAWCISQSRETRLLYMVVATWQGRDISEIDPDSLKILRTQQWDLFSLTSMALTPEEDALYCQSNVWDGLTKVRVKDFAIERVYEGERHARYLSLDPKRNVIYVLGYCSGKVFSIDLESGKRLWEIRVGGRPHGMHLDSQDRLWIHSMSGVFRIDLPSVWKDK